MAAFDHHHLEAQCLRRSDTSLPRSGVIQLQGLMTSFHSAKPEIIHPLETYVSDRGGTIDEFGLTNLFHNRFSLLPANPAEARGWIARQFNHKNLPCCECCLFVVVEWRQGFDGAGRGTARQQPAGAAERNNSKTFSNRQFYIIALFDAS